MKEKEQFAAYERESHITLKVKGSRSLPALGAVQVQICKHIERDMEELKCGSQTGSQTIILTDSQLNKLSVCPVRLTDCLPQLLGSSLSVRLSLTLLKCLSVIRTLMSLPKRLAQKHSQFLEM